MDENSRFSQRNFTKFLVTSAILCGTILLTNQPIEAQLLSQVRSAARSSSSPASDSSSNDDSKRSRRSDCNEEDDDSFLGQVLGALLFGSSDEDQQRTDIQSETDNDIDYEIYASDETHLSFLDFPYAGGHWGGSVSELETGKPFLSQAAFWYGSDFDTIDSWNFQFRADNRGPWGIDFQWAHLAEKSVGLPGDSLNLADINLTYRWIDSPEWVVRLGAGMNFLVDRFGTEMDYNLTMTSDLFPARHWIASFEIDHGEIGSTHQTHLLSTLGWNYRHLQIMTGYEYRKIGRVEIDGPLLGLRLWW